MNSYGSVYDVMSSGEVKVTDYLKSLNVYWVFESPVFVQDDKGRPRIWSPDFYLPEMGVYIEVMGPHSNYEYRMKVYEGNRIPIIFIDPYNDLYWTNKIKDQLWIIHNDRYALLKGNRFF